MNTIRNVYTRLAIKSPSNRTFYTSYRNHLQYKVLNLEDRTFNKFIELLQEFNVYIVGHSLLYHKLGLDEYNDKLDLFIDIANLKSFLDKNYMEFIPISLKFTSKYSTLHEDIIEVIYNFTSVGKHTQIYLHIYNNLAIDSFINNNLSIFGIYWNQFESNVNINNITEKLFTKEANEYTYPKLSNLNLSEDEEIFLETKGLHPQYAKPNTKYTDYDTMIIKELISNLSIYLFISKTDEENLDIRGVNQNNLLLSYNQIIQNQNFNHYNTGVNASNKYKILSTLDFILFMYANNKSVLSSNLYIYDLFYKAFIEFAAIFDISIKIKNYIDIVIREQILNKYQIEIKIDDENNIKFDISDVCNRDLLTSNDDAYIKEVLLFYYKKQIYKLKSNYKFLDLITHKHKLLDVNFNINTDIPYIKERSVLDNIYTKKQPSNIDKDKIDTYDKILQVNDEFTYHDIIYGDKIDVKDIISYINKDDNIILIEHGAKTITCISKSSLDELISNYKDNWFYDCSKFKSDYFSNPYIKVCTVNFTHYIRYQYVYSLLKSKNRVFYINPTDIIIEKTASYKNTPIGQINGLENGVSSNNCQDDTKIKLSTISTLFMKSMETQRTNDKINKISLNRKYPISLIR
jgi:hypothetical protein